MTRHLPVRALALVLAASIPGATTQLSAQEATARTVVIRAGRLIDGTGAAPVTDAVIVIRGERIAAVGPSGDVDVPAGADVVDLSGSTVLPGFVDAHVHMTGITTGEPGWENEFVRETPADAALRGAGNARRTLLAGFTSVDA